MLIECPSCQTHFVVSGPGEHPCPVCDHVCKVNAPQGIDSRESLDSSEAFGLSETPVGGLDSSENDRSWLESNQQTSGDSFVPPPPNLSSILEETPVAPEGGFGDVEPFAPPPGGIGLAVSSSAQCAIHPGTPAEGTCSRCGNFLCQECRGWIDHDPYCVDCYYKVEADTRYILWEDDTSMESGWKKFWGTTGELLSKPVDVYERMPTEGGLSRPLWYACLAYGLGFLGIMATQALVMIPTLATSPLQSSGAQLFGVLIGIFVVFLLFLPIGIILGMFVGAGMFHICLRIFGSGKEGFETTFRLYCYSTAPYVLGLIPFCGLYVAGFWQMALQVIGGWKAHRTELWRVICALFLPFFVLVVLVVLFFVGFAMVSQSGSL